MALRLDTPAVYEIYPRSFVDSTGSGEGDFAGIVTRLDYIRDLGVDAIWLAPFYPSGGADGGYDITDHRAVDRRYGDLGDFDRIVNEADRRGLGVIVDMVLNHTSEQHPWFQAALTGDAAMAARYVWRDPRPDGTPPNNWQSYFGGSAWRWSHRRRQYYLHQYLEKQPALDLRCEAVQVEHEATIRFWRDRGVSGFRFDAVTAYLCDPEMRDNPPASADARSAMAGPHAAPYNWQDHKHDILPGDCAEFMARVRHWAGAQMWLLGEGASGNEALSLTRRFTEPGRLDALYVPTCRERFTDPGFHAEVAEALQASGTMAWWIGSHDSPRAATTLGDGSAASAKALIAVMALSPGPLLLFQGDELGLPQPRLDRHEISDPFDLEFWPDGPGRENARVPPPWRDARHGGFTTGTSWLPMRWSGVASAQAQANNPDSVLSFTRDMLAMRRRFGWGRPDQFSVQAQGPLLRIQTRGDRGPTTANINLSPETAGDAQPWCVSLSTSDERQSNKRA